MSWRVVFTIAGQEFRQSLRNRSFLGLMALLVFLFVVATVVSTKAHRKSAGEMQHLQALVARQWVEQPDRHPHRVAHYGYLAFRPRSPLGFFDFGVSDFTGNSIFLEAHLQNSANFSEARQDSSLLRFGALTPAFVLQNLVPLLVIFLMASSVSRERESGTLAQVLAQGVQWRELSAGKALGGTLVFCALLLPASSAVSLFAGHVTGSASGEDLLRLCLLAIFHFLSLLIWVQLSVLVSAKSSTTGRSTVILLGIWIVTTTFLPKALPSLGAYMYPAPSRPEFESKLHIEVVGGGHGHDPKAAQFERKKEELLRKHNVDSVEELPVNWRGIAMSEGEKASTDVYQKHYLGLQGTYARQNKVGRWGAVLSPYLALRNLSAGLCGTDFRASVQFEREAEAYRYALIQKLNELHTHEIEYEGDKSQRVSAHHWKDFEAFGYERPSLQADLRSCHLSLLVLFSQVLLLGLLASRVEGRVR